MTRFNRLRLLEFLVIGVVMGIIEDLIAITVATGATISPHVIWIVFLVALPFAFLSEVVVDHPRFWERIFPSRGPSLTEDRK